jgi:hypothetical protein
MADGENSNSLAVLEERVSQLQRELEQERKNRKELEEDYERTKTLIIRAGTYGRALMWACVFIGALSTHLTDWLTVTGK